MGSRSTPAILLREATRPEPVEGETFSSNPAHPYWRVRVRFTTGLKPSMERIRAATAAQALEFVLARYPFACRSGSEVLGRWDAASAPIDRMDALAAKDWNVRVVTPTAPAASVKPLPPPQSAPTFHCTSKPMTKPALGADLKRLPRDRQGRAVLSEEVFPAIVAANDGGMSWPVIADTLGCAERNMRERVAKWKRHQVALGNAKEALRASVAEKRQQGGPVPDGAPVGGADGREQFLPFRLCTVSTTAAQQQPQPEPEGESKDAPVDSGLWLVHANGRMVAEGQPLELAERLVSVLAGAGIGCSRTPDEGVHGPRTTSRRVAFSRGYDQGQADERADLAARLAKSEWLRLIRSDGVAAAIAKASDQPTPSPVITPTKVGGFTIQITVNPVESGG
jgi:hypothetical protein